MPFECPHCQKPIENAIPKDRFDKVYEERRAAKAKVSELQEALEAAKATAEKAEDYQARLERLQGELESERAKFSTYQAISGAGITDPDLVAAVEWAYSRLPEEGRPALGDWLNEIRQDPDKAPVVLRPHLQAPASQQHLQAPASQQQQQQSSQDQQQQQSSQDQQQQQSSQDQQQQSQPPPSNAGTGQFSQAPSNLSAEAIARMTPEQYKAAREALLNSLRR